MLLRLLNFMPQEARAEPVVQAGPAAPPDVRRPLTVCTWNLQFCGTRRHRYFYDGGPDTFVDPANVREAIAAVRGVLDVLTAEGLDLALLQEVDRDSARTGRVDELAALVEGWPSWVSTPYHRSRFVPHPLPPRRPLGRVELHEAILARFPLGAAVRIPLPPLAEPPVRQAFNLHRALLTSRVPLSDGRTLHVGCTHLSAFSRGDGTMRRQIDVLRAWMDACGSDPFILGGDFNLLVPGDDARRLGADAAEYAEDVLERLEARAQRVPALGAHTYLPPGADRPDRTLDHLFFSPDLIVESARVVDVPAWVSDHLPLVATVRFDGSAARPGGPTLGKT